MRHVFEAPINFQTGAYSDFTSFSLYLSDIVIITFIGLGVVKSIKDKVFLKENSRIYKFWLMFAALSIVWLILELILQSHTYLSLQFYFTARLIILITFAYFVSHAQVSREKLAWIFTITGAAQALIAIYQFYFQKSFGLYILGESHLSPSTLGVAKIVSHGTTLIRGYGTFPHSNLLAAFLVTTTLFNIYLLTKTYQIPRGIILHILLVFNVFGLFITMSRGGIFALAIGLLILAAYFLINKHFSRGTKLLIPVGIIVGLSVLILAPYLLTRATITDHAVREREFYNRIGIGMIQKNPTLGLGAGASVLHMKQQSNTNLEPWEIQPIHNFFLISVAEWGIGSIFFLTLVILPIYGLFKANISNFNLILLAIIASFLALFLFDHYFYTIWPTQILLWLIIGLILQNSSTWNKI
jgi:hypothetical protein